MDIFSALTMVGGLCLFLFGMSLMGQALEKRAGGGLRTILGKMTTGKLAGFLTGCGVTTVIQSSSATTVMVVGFVNSGLMTLKQAINVIMGANVGTTVTSWILSLAGISSDNVWIKMLKPSSFTPLLAFVGIVLFMFAKSDKKKDTGMIFLGFATLMYGMETMTSAVSGLSEVPAFRQLFMAFSNPVLGVLAGALLTAVIQSSSASVGILQALAMTGQITYASAIPIVMGQNIGTCITAVLSSIGANKSAKRAAFVHLSFNVIGTAVWLSAFSLVSALAHPAILGQAATTMGIAVAHSTFNTLCVIILMPLSSLLERLALTVIKDNEQKEKDEKLDERLLSTPPLALEQCKRVTADMGRKAIKALSLSTEALKDFSPELAQNVKKLEQKTDKYEDICGTYLIKLSSKALSDSDSEEATALLKVIGDFERIGDHAVNILESAEELSDKKLTFSKEAQSDLSVMINAVNEITGLTVNAFVKGDSSAAKKIEPLEQVIDAIKEEVRTRHIMRMRRGDCSPEAGFVLSDIITNLERVSDHCSNVAVCIIDKAVHNLNVHETLHALRHQSEQFKDDYKAYSQKYQIVGEIG